MERAAYAIIRGASQYEPPTYISNLRRYSFPHECGFISIDSSLKMY